MRNSSVQRPMAGGIRIALLATMCVALLAQTAAAQQPDRERRRQFVEGLLQTLLDSQLPPRQTPPQDSRPPIAQPPHLVPPTYIAPPVANLSEVRSQLDSFAAESRALLSTLQGQWSDAGLVGPLIGETATIHHAASALAAKSRRLQLHDLTPLAEDYATLNRDWRVLAHRIDQNPNLSRRCDHHLGTLDRHDRRLRELLGVQPQLDIVSLVRQTTALAVDLQNLGEDLQSDLPPSSERNRLVSLCRQARQSAGEVIEAVFGNAPHETVQHAYQSFRDDWSKLAAALRPVDNHYVQRTVRRVWRTDRDIHELLWLSYQTDPGQILHVAQVLRDHIDLLYDTVSLEDLIDLPPARKILPTASEFYGLCEYFILCTEDKDSLEDLAQAYWDLDAAWPEFSECFAAARSPQVQQTLAEIERSMSGLREIIGIPPALDWELAAQRSARLEYLAHSLESNLESTQKASARYPSHVRGRITSAAAKSRSFCTACGSLNSKIVAKTDPRRLAADCGNIAQSWAALQSDMIAVFREEDVNRSTAEIAKTIVELQTTFGP